eukprot:gene60762-83106_t
MCRAGSRCWAACPSGQICRIILSARIQPISFSNGISRSATYWASSISGQADLLKSLGLTTSVGSGKADLLKSLGLTTSVGSGIATATANPNTAAGSLGSLVQAGSTLNVNGKTITFSDKTSTDVK